MLKFINWCDEQHMDIIGISETNFTDKESAFLVPVDKDYIRITTEKDNKIKGSGVALLLEERWAAHIGQKRVLDHYLIHRHFAATESHKHHYTIIMGDFNSIVNSNMDRDGNTRFNKRPSNLVSNTDI